MTTLEHLEAAQIARDRRAIRKARLARKAALETFRKWESANLESQQTAARLAKLTAERFENEEASPYVN